ncbi:MAG: NFYB/HAP3 family transcription factor subunit [Candidatus Aenigmatarchaeota archaeon]
MPREHLLPILPFERIAKRAGARRMSREGIEELREIIEEEATSIAEQAVRVALHAGRKTVTSEDVTFVIENLARIKVSSSLPPKVSQPQ